MEEWVTLERDFPTKERALKAAGIIQIAESRLSNSSKGPQYDIETEIFETKETWRVKWRKVFVGYNSGCSNCSSCQGAEAETDQLPKTGNRQGKLIQFKRNIKETID